MIAAGATAIGVSVLAGCGSTSAVPKQEPPFIWVDETSSPFVNNFNPFSTSDPVVDVGLGYLYEPLLYINTYTGKIVPELASSYSYNSSHTVLTFNLRHNIKWSDGVPFTSKDVVATFNMILHNPQIDLTGVGALVQSAVANGPYQVIITLTGPNVGALYMVAGNTPIVPAHIWDHVSNPATFTNPHPVTTGPFLLGSYSRSEFTLVRNPHYWGGAPSIKEIEVPLLLGNNPATLAMEKGDFSFATQFVPNIQTTLLSRSPHYHDWFPPAINNVLYVNNAIYPYSLPALRWAISDAINRPLISRLGEYGYEPPDNPVALPPTPLYNTYVSKAVEQRYHFIYDPAKSKQILKAAGFTWNGQGALVDPRGQVVAPTIIVSAGGTDIVADSGIIAKELAQIGINATVKTPALMTDFSDLASGHYQLGFEVAFGYGPSAYDLYDGLMGSVFYKPIGQFAADNWERWQSPVTARLLQEYATTFSQSRQRAIMAELEGIFAKNLPIIPVVIQPGWEEYNSTYFTGFPTSSNPYSATISGWNNQYMLTHIRYRFAK